MTAADVPRAMDLIAGSRAGRHGERDASLSLGDGLCLAVAERLKLPVTGGDQMWAELSLAVPFIPFRA